MWWGSLIDCPLPQPFFAPVGRPVLPIIKNFLRPPASPALHEAIGATALAIEGQPGSKGMANDTPPPPPPAPPAPPGIPEVAYVEEYNEEAQAANPATRQTANISTKRSKPDVASSKAPHDGISDSGHSSHTAGTLGSSATSLESKTGSNPPKVETNTAASKRRPIGVEDVVKTRSHSPEKPPIRRTQSKSQRERHAQLKKPCNCSECVAKARRSSASLEPSKHPESKSKAKSRPTFGGLLRSTKPRPAQVVPDVPILQPIHARPRASTTQSYHQPARPVSFHAGAIAPQPVFVQQPLIIERQPSYPTPSPFPPSSFPPPQQPYFPPPPQPVPAPRDYYTPLPSPYTTQSRPRPRQWSSDQRPTSRSHSMYYGTSPPIIEYGEEPIYTTIAPGVRPAPRQSVPRVSTSSSPEDYTIRPEDYYKMPPPPPKIKTQAQTQQRPPMIRHAHTTSDAHPSLQKRRSRHEDSVEAHVGNRSPIKQSFAEHERSRRPDVRPAKKSDDAAPSIHAVERGISRVNIESNTAKHKRRASVYGHESLHDLERSVETYQAATKGVPTAPHALPIDSLPRKHKTSSETSSRHSGKSGKSRTSREGSEVKSRRPSSEIKNRNENDGLAMRFNASKSINLNLKGDIKDQTISLRPSKDGGEGEMELSIGARGRPAASRPPIAGREKSRRRYSYIDGQAIGVKEVERSKTTSRPPLRGYSYIDDRGVTELERVRTSGSSSSAGLERVRTAGSFTESVREEREPRIIRERIITTSRSRRSSRSGRGLAD